MQTDRRRFLQLAGFTAATASTGAVSSYDGAVAQPRSRGDWEWVRNQFDLSADRVHMSAMLLSSHPKPVRDAIEKHRRGLDTDPVLYLENNMQLTGASRAAAAHYLGIDGSQIALTDSTTMGLGLVYNGLELRPGQEILTTTEDYFVTHESVRLASGRSGAEMRRIALFDNIAEAREEEIVDRIIDALRPATRAVALTWVHSSTGLKVPIAALAQRLREINAQRDEEDQVLLCVDGVHGFGVEDADMTSLGCDFLIAGCHKWLFGPRGTGIVAATGRGLASVRPTIPSFDDGAVFDGWINESDPAGSNNGQRMSPGGFKPFEHRWALAQAFEFHGRIGKAEIAERTHELASQLKEGLARLPGIVVVTPRSPGLSSGIVSFDVEGLAPTQVVSALRERSVVASAAPYAQSHVRLTPSMRNTTAEVDQAIAAVADLAA